MGHIGDNVDGGSTGQRPAHLESAGMPVDQPVVL